jgi:hypothetical protein
VLRIVLVVTADITYNVDTPVLGGSKLQNKFLWNDDVYTLFMTNFVRQFSNRIYKVAWDFGDGNFSDESQNTFSHKTGTYSKTNGHLSVWLPICLQRHCTGRKRI